MLDSPEKIHDALMKEYERTSAVLIPQTRERLAQEKNKTTPDGQPFSQAERSAYEYSQMLDASIDAAMSAVAEVISHNFARK